MRIKTTKEVVDIIDDVKDLLNFTTKADVLKLAINLSIFNNLKEIKVVLEDGFEVDTLIIFEAEHAYYDQLISNFFNVENVQKEHYLNLINNGMKHLEIEFKKSKNNKETFIFNILSQIKEEDDVSR